MRVALLIAVMVATGCSERPANSKFHAATCQEKATGRKVQAEAFYPLGLDEQVSRYVWHDPNGFRRTIDARNSDQWSCKLNA